MAVNAFATGLDHPRTLYVLPNGDVLVAETNAPRAPDENRGIKGWITGMVMGRAGADTTSANRITLLRDADGDGVAETRSVFLEGLNSPFGMALVGNDFYVANSDAIMKFPYHAGDTKITAPGVKLADLPGGALNHHWTKDLVAVPDGIEALCDRRLQQQYRRKWHGGRDQSRRACLKSIVPPANRACSRRAFAIRTDRHGSRKAAHCGSSVNERDELGNDLVPDYMTSVKDGGFYGWPYSYYGQHVDARVQPQRPDLVAKAIAPDYALGAHTASLGLTFNTGKLFPPDMADGAFIGQHGSWNRKPRAGYKVIFVPFANGMPAGAAAGRADRIPQQRRRGARPAGGRRHRQAGRAARGGRCRQRGLARHAGQAMTSLDAKMLGEFQALRLIVGADALAVHRIGRASIFS